MANNVLHNILGDKCSCNYCMAKKLAEMQQQKNHKHPKKDKHSHDDMMVAGTPVSLNRG
jgi:hypothetical protein